MFFLPSNNNVVRSVGFALVRSCNLQLLLCIEEISKQLDDENNVDVVYTDFSKAFDRVSHCNLIRKILNLGITEKVGAWIKDFLTDRYQRVKIEYIKILITCLMSCRTTTYAV